MKVTEAEARQLLQNTTSNVQGSEDCGSCRWGGEDAKACSNTKSDYHGVKLDVGFRCSRYQRATTPKPPEAEPARSGNPPTPSGGRPAETP